MDQNENMEFHSEGKNHEERKREEEERYYSRTDTKNPVQKLNFSPQKSLSPNKHRPSNAFKSGERTSQSNWNSFPEYDEIIRTIESDESISGNLKLALVSMAKMSNETQKSVQNICEGQTELSNRIDRNAKIAADGHIATQNLLRELLGKGDDSAKKHPRSGNFPPDSYPNSSHNLSISAFVAKPPSSEPHHPINSPPQQLDCFNIPHLFLSSRFLTTKPFQQKHINPQTFYILPKRPDDQFKMDPVTFRQINSLVVQTCRKIRIAPPTRIAPLKSGNKAVVVLHTSSHIPTLLQSLTLPQDFFASEFITPPQPVKLLLNGLSDSRLGPMNIVKTIFLCNKDALKKIDHRDLIYLKHSKCRKQSELGHNKHNITFLASPKFIRLLSNMQSCVYVGNDKFNMSDCTTNFFCTNCCSLDHLSHFTGIRTFCEFLRVLGPEF